MPLPDPHRSRVVLIGASTFTDPALAELPAVRNNLTDLAACFCDPDLWGLPESHCVVVPDPELPDDFLDPIHTAAEAAEDTLLVYYAGHGQLDYATNELLLAVGRSKSGRSHTSVRYEYVQRDVRNARARRRVVILDCCYAGKAMADAMADPTTAVADEASATGTYLIASAPPNKQALSPPGEPHTAFTGELITLLRSGLPGGDQFLDLDAIYRHVFYALRDKSRPEPQKRAGNTAGDLALARNIRWRSAQTVTMSPKMIKVDEVTHARLTRLAAERNTAIADWEETKAARTQASQTHRHGDLRNRIKELAREDADTSSFACPVCDVTVSRKNLLRHFDTHRPDETTGLDAATLSLEQRQEHWNSYQLDKIIGGTERLPERLATDTRTGQPVVVKTMNTDDHIIIRNVGIAATFDHPGIVRILDRVQTASRLRYIVLEYVVGQLLAEAERPMEPRRAAWIISMVCDALHYGHHWGLVHGKINGLNVIITEEGAVKLLNFGTTFVSSEAADIRSDVYGAGRLLFELVGGRSLLGVDLPRGVPAALRKVIETALHPDLAKRYQSAAEMRDALRQIY